MLEYIDFFLEHLFLEAHGFLIIETLWRATGYEKDLWFTAGLVVLFHSGNAPYLTETVREG